MTVEEAAASVAQSEEMLAGAEAVRRLQRCYEAINGDDRAGETLGAIAYSFGFRSEAQFNHTFKERFGMSPRKLRSVARERGVNTLPPIPVGVAPDLVQRLER